MLFSAFSRLFLDLRKQGKLRLHLSFFCFYCHSFFTISISMSALGFWGGHHFGTCRNLHCTSEHRRRQRSPRKLLNLEAWKCYVHDLIFYILLDLGVLSLPPQPPWLQHPYVPWAIGPFSICLVHQKFVFHKFPINIAPKFLYKQTRHSLIIIIIIIIIIYFYFYENSHRLVRNIEYVQFKYSISLNFLFPQWHIVFILIS